MLPYSSKPSDSINSSILFTVLLNEVSNNEIGIENMNSHSDRLALNRTTHSDWCRKKNSFACWCGSHPNPETHRFTDTVRGHAHPYASSCKSNCSASKLATSFETLHVRLLTLVQKGLVYHQHHPTAVETDTYQRKSGNSIHRHTCSTIDGPGGPSS